MHPLQSLLQVATVIRPVILLSMIAMLSGSTAVAQQQQGGGGQGGGQGGGGQAGGGGQGGGAAGLTQVGVAAEDVFSIDRSGAVGANTAATPGARQGTGAAGGGGGAAGGLGRGGIGGIGGIGGMGGLFGGAFGGQQGQGTGQPALRTRLRSGVDVAPMLPQQVQTRAVGRFRQLPTANQINGIGIVMEGRTAILTGEVASEQQRRMSELLIRLEPGVSQVENRLTVAP